MYNYFFAKCPLLSFGTNHSDSENFTLVEAKVAKLTFQKIISKNMCFTKHNDPMWYMSIWSFQQNKINADVVILVFGNIPKPWKLQRGYNRYIFLT